SHMDGKAMQVQHIAANSVNAKERWKVARRLKRNNWIGRGILRFDFGEGLRESRDCKAPGQDIDCQTSPEARFDSGEQANQGKRVTPEVEKVGPRADRRCLQQILPDVGNLALETRCRRWVEGRARVVMWSRRQRLSV